MQTPNDAPLTDYELVKVYRAETDGSLWVRRNSEFRDGRFEELPDELAHPAPAAAPADDGEVERFPICIGRHSIEKLAEESLVTFDDGSSLIAASDLYKRNPYARADAAEARATAAEARVAASVSVTGVNRTGHRHGRGLEVSSQ